VIEFRNPEHPWPDKPHIPELVLEDPFDFEGSEHRDVDAAWDEYAFQDRFEEPSEKDIGQENTRMLRRQCLYRWAAQSVARAMSQLPEVLKVAAFGAVAQPLKMKVPPFREFRRHGIEVLHGCADLDLAVETTSLSGLKELKRAMSSGLSLVQDTAWGGVAHHQVDVHIFDAGAGPTGDGSALLGNAPSRGRCSAWSAVAGRSHSCSSSKDTGLIPRNSKASRMSRCSTGPADSSCAAAD